MGCRLQFAAGSLATPDAAPHKCSWVLKVSLLVQRYFKSGDPKKRAGSIVRIDYLCRPDILAQVSEDLGEAMVGINKDEIDILMAERGK